MTRIEARYVYELLRQLPERNFAKDHSFEEWYAVEVMGGRGNDC